MKTCGIYMIRNTVNGKKIIGSSVNIESRWSAYKCNLRRDRYENTYLQRAWNKYTESSFEFLVIEECKEEDLFVREDAWIKYYDSINRSYGYNQQTADRKIHYYSHKFTPEQLLEMSKAQLGRKHSPETITKMKLSHKHTKHTEETKRKISERRKGVRTTPIGYKRSEESNKKQSDSMKGKVAWNKGKTGIYSAETIEKIRQGAFRTAEKIRQEKLNVT